MTTTLTRVGLREKYITTIAAVLLIGGMALLAYATHLSATEADKLRRLGQEESSRLLRDLERRVATARNHLSSMQFVSQTTMQEDARIDPAVLERFVPSYLPGPEGFPFDAIPTDHHRGTLVVRDRMVGPIAGFKTKGSLQQEDARRLTGVLSMIEMVAASHENDPMFAWSYFYDADESFSWIYPSLNRYQMLQTTGSTSADGALSVILDADGTKPLEWMNKKSNPQRNIRWTRAYTDMGGQGLMVTLLAPVDVRGVMRGVVGADITLKDMARMLHNIDGLPFRVLVVNEYEQVLVDGYHLNKPGEQAADARKLLGETLLQYEENHSFTRVGDTEILVQKISGTDWKMISLYSPTVLRQQVLSSIAPMIGVSFAVVMLLGGILYVMHGRYAQPALKLAEYLEDLKHNADTPMPSVPSSWQPRFAHAALVEQERRQLLGSMQRNAEELEMRVAQRTAELEGVNTDLSQALSSLRHTQRQLINAEKHAALSTLVAGVAHDLNTPIGTALTVATTMADKSDMVAEQVQAGSLKRSTLNQFIEDNRTASRILTNNLTRAAELVSSFKRVAVDQASENRRDFHLHELVHSIAVTMAPTLRSTPHIQLVCEADDVAMDSYPGALVQVLVNLVNNALLHAFQNRASGHIHIRAQAQPDSGLVRLVIEDDGHGIPTDIQDQIFEPFYTTRMGQGGSGLGLTIVMNIVTNVLGGTVELDSVPGRGTAFIIVIPPKAPVQKEVAHVAASVAAPLSTPALPAQPQVSSLLS